MRPTVRCDLINGPFGDPVVFADIMFERRALLFDIGDIAVLPPRQVLRVSHVFVSHTHLDHFAGFDRLLRLLLGRDRAVTMYGPAGFIARVEHKLHAYTWNVIRGYGGNLTFVVHELNAEDCLARARFQSREEFFREDLPECPLEHGIIASVGSIVVRCAILDHSTPCLGFALEEPAHVNLWRTRVDEFGLEVGPWLNALKHAILLGADDSTPINALRRGAHVALPLGDLREIARIVPGIKIAYVVDVCGHAANLECIERLARNADTLFIECAFLAEDSEHAKKKNHLTAWEAGIVARRAGVKRLVPCHFSTRYSNRADALVQEAKRAFQVQ